MNQEQQEKQVPETQPVNEELNVTRRDFVKGAAVTTAAVFAGTAYGALGTNYAHAQGAGRIKVGWIGAGGRGNGAVRQNLDAAPEMLLWAIGDVFPGKAKGARDGIARDEKYKSKVDVTDDRCFGDFDNYKGVIDSGIDLLVHATPPGFRPPHIAYAVEKGKHVFSEKPFAVDAWGVQKILDAAKMADEKKLGIVAGTQRRHDASYIQTINRIKEGAIGDLISGQCYWNQGGLWDRGGRDKYKNDMEWQLNQWYYFTWICGDLIVEQHIHNLDVMNWVIGAHPESAVGMGGRQVRTQPQFGHIYDHFATELTYPGGIKVLSFARHQDNTAGNVSEFIQGSKGTSNCSNRIWAKGEAEWKAPGGGKDAYQQEHDNLVNSIKAGKPLNEGVQIAESTLTAIMCREACYTGKQIRWNDLLKSGQQLFQANYEWGPLPIPPVPTPGRTMIKRVDISQEMIDELKKAKA
jgi:predicted dehydrogenase